MDVSGASFRRGDRPSDCDSSLSLGYRSSSLSVYDAFEPKQVSRDDYGGISDPLGRDGSGPLSRDGLGNREGYTEPPSYGGYSYSSSYEDMRRSGHGGRYFDSGHYEDSKSFGASACGKYEYGSDKAPSLHESYRGPLLDSYYKSHLGLDGSVPSSSSLTSNLYGYDGQNVRHLDLSYHKTADDYQMQYDYMGLNESNVTSLNKPNVVAFEQSPPSRDHSAMLHHYDMKFLHNDVRGLVDASTAYEQASALSRKHYSSYSDMFPSLGASGDWRNAMGRAHDSESLLGDVHELCGKAANGSRVEGSNAYTDFNKWDEGGIRRTGNISGLLSSSEGVDLVTGKKKRQSRWEPVEEDEKNGENGAGKKKRKSRWAEEKPSAKDLQLPDVLKGEDPEMVNLRTQLIIINRKLQSGKVIDDVPEADRSPSPPAVFDNFGYRVNTREYRTRERLTKERQQIIAKLAQKIPTFKPPPDSKAKFSRKVSIPVDKFPDYNFVGLIIGPRGNTLKKMEKESGAKILIRGKGSVREGTVTVTDVIEAENLHVLIEADLEESLNKAADMVEKLLVPVGDEYNEHKRAQLRELATLNGTLRTKESCQVIQEVGHVAAKDSHMASSILGSSVAVAQKVDTSQDKQICHVCMGPGHLSKVCPLIRPKLESLWKGGSAGSVGADLDSGLSNGNDNTLVYVSFLPLSVNDSQLRNLFAPLGQVVHAKVMRHLTTGISKSYGFVKFADAGEASQAVALMNGYKLDGKVLSVNFKINAGAEG